MRYSIFFILLFVLCSCKKENLTKSEFEQNDKDISFFKGFVLFNPSTKEEIINYNGSKYFTPASNTKLFTLYTAYKTFKDSVQSLKYFKTNDSLIIKGTADPSFLNGFGTSKVLDFLRNEKDSIYLIDASIEEAPYGNGWAWDDYQENYMPEKSLFPIYGNVVRYKIRNGLIKCIPAFFKNDVTVKDSISLIREPDKNTFYLKRDDLIKKEVPFKTSNYLITQLLSDTLHKKIKVISDYKKNEFNILHGVPYDTLYKKMLKVSDNFIAEQLMLKVGKEVGGSYSVKKAIKYSLDNYLNDLPQKPTWVDGSGLSRYNLFSPNDMVFLLEKMYNEIPLEQLLGYFPIIKTRRTFMDWNRNKKPFIFAKPGSVMNNYNLSGFLITKKGTLLIFSYMNNHFNMPTYEVKKDIESELKRIYNTY